MGRRSNKAEPTLAPNLSLVGTQSQQTVKGFEAEVVIAGSTDKAESTYPKKRPKYQATGKGTFS